MTVPGMTVPFHIAVFARAPQAGSAKTRLIPLLGAQGAAAAQRAMTLRTLATACSAAPGAVSLCVAEECGHAFFAECAQQYGVSCHAQSGVDLGARMAACLHTLLAQHPAVLLIGTDCPVMSGQDLQAAAQALQQGAALVFAPAEDGGYVLVGAQGQHAAAGIKQAFAAIDWGTPQVMAQTRARLATLGWQAGREWHETHTLWDVDTPADYQRALLAGVM